jgi:hypothetical protein
VVFERGEKVLYGAVKIVILFLRLAIKKTKQRKSQFKLKATTFETNKNINP